MLDLRDLEVVIALEKDDDARIDARQDQNRILAAVVGVVVGLPLCALMVVHARRANGQAMVGAFLVPAFVAYFLLEQLRGEKRRFPYLQGWETKRRS